MVYLYIKYIIEIRILICLTMIYSFQYLFSLDYVNMYIEIYQEMV